MEVIYMKRISEVIQKKRELEGKLKVKININGRNVSVEGDSINEYEAISILEAINFGFSMSKALVLKDEDFVFRKIHIKDYTKRSLEDVKGRLIGKGGKTRKTFSEISGCELIIKYSEVGVIGDVESVENTTRAITNVIRGSKQSNMYRYLEKMNRVKKEEDLGLK